MYLHTEKSIRLHTKHLRVWNEVEDPSTSKMFEKYSFSLSNIYITFYFLKNHKSKKKQNPKHLGNILVGLKGDWYFFQMEFILDW